MTSPNIEQTRKLAEDMIGTACMQDPEVQAEERGFVLCTATFDDIAFVCTCCEWVCSQDECNEDASGQWICDDCKRDEG